MDRAGPTNIGGRTRAVMFDPNDADDKKVWAGGVSGGLWYTNDITDENATWTKVDDFLDNISIVCIAYDPNDIQTFYVGTGEGFGAAAARGAGIWKSTDGGSNWSQLSVTENYYYVNDIIVRNESGTSVIYAAVSLMYYQGEWHGSKEGLYRSINGGTSFTQVLPDVSGQSWAYAPADIELGADNRIYIGTRRAAYESTQAGGSGSGTVLYSDDGTSWTIGETFTDGARVELACAPYDAGSSSSPSFTNRNNDYNITQFYACAIHPTEHTNYFLAGSQDNGSHQFDTQGLDETKEVTGGDGAFCFIDQTDANYQFTSYVYNSYYRSTDAGVSFSSIMSDQTTGKIINSCDYDNNQDILFASRSTTTILRFKDLTGTYSNDNITISGLGSTASHIRVSLYTVSSSTIFIGTGSGLVFKVTDADGTHSSTNITGGSFPRANISCIEIGANENELIMLHLHGWLQIQV